MTGCGACDGCRWRGACLSTVAPDALSGDGTLWRPTPDGWVRVTPYRPEPPAQPHETARDGRDQSGMHVETTRAPEQPGPGPLALDAMDDRDILRLVVALLRRLANR